MIIQDIPVLNRYYIRSISLFTAYNYRDVYGKISILIRVAQVSNVECYCGPSLYNSNP